MKANKLEEVCAKSSTSRLIKIIIMLIVILQMLFQASCVGNKKQIQKVYLVVAMGIDLNPDGRYEVTMQVLNPSAPSGQTAGGTSNPSSSSKEVLIYSGIGDSFPDAVQEASKTMRKVQHFGHLKYIALGEQLIETGDKTLADSIFRLEEIRFNTPLLATKGRASEVVSAQTNEGLIPANVVSDLLDRQEVVGYRPYTYMLDVVNALGSKTTAPVIAVINLVKTQDKAGAETYKLSGTAVFKEGKLAGYLNDKETRGLNWIRGKVEVGSLTAICPTLGNVALEVLRSSSKITPAVEGSNVTLNIKINVSFILRGLYTKVNPIKEPQLMDEIGAAASKAVEEEVKLALSAARERLNADIFGFGEKFHAAYPKEWAAMEKDWDSIYENMSIDVVVESKVRNTGSILKSVQ
jgi:spore germination protein KC